MQFDLVHITSLFENATEGFVITDSKGMIILVNPAACRMFDYKTVDELQGQKIEILIPGNLRSKHVELRDDYYKDPHDRIMGHGRDLKGQKKNGVEFPVEVSLSTYLHEDNRYFIAFIIDITHRKQIEENMLQQQQELEKISNDMMKLNAELENKVEERTTELKAALDKERELNEMKTRFVSMASHEFRTPLSTVLSSASLIGKYESEADQEKRERHIEKIKRSVNQLNDLLEDFLSMGKLDEGKTIVAIQYCDLHILLQDTMDEMKALTREGQEILLTHSGDASIETDPRLVKNILLNLISNAIKFSSGNIMLNSEVKNKVAVVSVADNGIGIAPGDKEYLFSSFFRGKNAANIQGTGLGLHIVKRYIDLLKGEIRLESELNKGTIITFTIPAKYE